MPVGTLRKLEKVKQLQELAMTRRSLWVRQQRGHMMILMRLLMGRSRRPDQLTKPYLCYYQQAKMKVTMAMEIKEVCTWWTS
jgi:hypothetical protein